MTPCDERVLSAIAFERAAIQKEMHALKIDAERWQQICRDDTKERDDLIRENVALSARIRELGAERKTLPTGDLRQLGSLLATMLDPDEWNRVEPYLEAAKVESAALQAELDNIKQVEFPKRLEKVNNIWRDRAEKAEAGRTHFQQEFQRATEDMLRAEAENVTLKEQMRVEAQQASIAKAEIDALKA